MKDITLPELKKKVKALGKVDEHTLNAFICLMVGHSRIQTTFFGYYSCARCSQQLGDTLGSYYGGAGEAVVVGHNCAKCKANFKECQWSDKLYVRNPFAKNYERSKYLEVL